MLRTALHNLLILTLLGSPSFCAWDAHQKPDCGTTARCAVLCGHAECCEDSAAESDEAPCPAAPCPCQEGRKDCLCGGAILSKVHVLDMPAVTFELPMGGSVVHEAPVIAGTALIAIAASPPPTAQQRCAQISSFLL